MNVINKKPKKGSKTKPAQAAKTIQKLHTPPNSPKNKFGYAGF
jgi:hypothetical protein